MTPAESKSARAPWLTVWFSPRRTIACVADRPSSLIWPLAVLGTIAVVYQQIAVVIGTIDRLTFRYALVLALLGVGGIVWLYLSAVVLCWIGRWFGGKANARQIRVAFAWSMLPAIAGGAVVWLVGVAMGRSEIASAAIEICTAVFSVWALIVFLAMLGQVEHFGWWRTIATYLVALLLLAFGMALLVRTFLYQSFSIPSASMRPTLMTGDYIFVSKF